MRAPLTRSRARRYAAALLLGIGLALASVAAAGTLEEAKREGWLGEQPSGYVGLVRPNAPADVRALATRVNRERAAHYDEIAQRNRTTRAAVAAIAGAKLIDRALPGEHVMTGDGRWILKP